MHVPQTKSRLTSPPLYVRASIVASCIGMLFGLDTGTIGSVTDMPAFSHTMGPLTSTLRGVLVSSILPPGALAALLAGALADRHGRKALLVTGALIYGLGASLECGAVALPMFLVGRIVKGLGQGLFLSTVYVQVSEMAPARSRGTLTALPQFLIVCGLVAGFFMAYGTQQHFGEVSSAAWRVPLAVAAALAFVFAAVNAAVLPPSPRWLLAQGRAEEARAVVAALGLGVDEQEELLATVEDQQHRLEKTKTATTTAELLGQTLREFGEAFAPAYRARTAFGCFLMAFQQFCGIDGVLYYAPILFRQAGIAGNNANFLASGVSSLVILAVTVAGTFVADRWGRRTSSLWGGAAITALMLLMGSLYAAGQVHAAYGAGRWVVIVSIYLFAIVYNGTWALAFRTFLVESLPRRTRSSASALGQCSNWIANYIVALTTPVFISRTTFGAYYFFAASAALCTVVCALFMFETKGHSLEVIEQRYQDGTANKSSALGSFWPRSAAKGPKAQVNVRSSSVSPHDSD